MISVAGLKVEFGVKPLFSNVSFVINDKEHVALTGKNGAGKSTLLKIMASLQHPTEGSVSMPAGQTVGYLPQTMKMTDTRTVKGEVELAFNNIKDMKAQLEQLNGELAERTDYESEEYSRLINRIADTTERLNVLGGQNYEGEIAQTLMGLGFERKDFEEFGRRIGLSERLVKRELNFFAAEHPLAKELIDRSFLSDSLKRSYWLSYKYRRATLALA